MRSLLGKYFLRTFLAMILKRLLPKYVTFFPLVFAIACESAEEKTAQRAAEVAQRSSQPTYTPDGAAVFRKNCVICHGSDGSLGMNGAKDLRASTLSLDERLSIITEGKKLMTPFGAILSPEEIKAVAEHTLTLKK